jgi:hypothetical protein
MTNMKERRSTHSRMELADGNGGKVKIDNFSVARWKAVLGVIAALLSIGGIVFSAAALGVRLGTRVEIEAQIREPLSPLNMHIGTMVNHAMDVRDSETNRSLAVHTAEITELKEGQAERRAQIQTMQQDLAEMRADIKELLRRVR